MKNLIAILGILIVIVGVAPILLTLGIVEFEAFEIPAIVYQILLILSGLSIFYLILFGRKDEQ